MNLSRGTARAACAPAQGWNLDALIEEESDAGLGTGTRSSRCCFIDSLATLQYPAIGYGLRYEYGIFRQVTVTAPRPSNLTLAPQHGSLGNPAAREVYTVPLNATFELRGSTLNFTPNAARLLGMATIARLWATRQLHQTLRLLAAAAPESFDFAEFSHGDFAGAVVAMLPRSPLHGCFTPTTRRKPAGHYASCSSISW